MKGKTADQKALLMEQLEFLGWNANELASELALPEWKRRSRILIQNLK